MYSDEQQSTRSPATSRTDSYRDGPTSRTNNGRAYQLRSTANKENGTEDNEYEETPGDDDEPARNELPPQRSEDQYIAALRYRFPSRPKTDYAYSKPLGPSTPVPPTPPAPSTTQQTPASGTTTTTTTPRTGPYQTSLRPTNGGTTTRDTGDDKTFPRPALRRVNPEQQNTYARRIGDETTTTSTSQSKPTTPGLNVRINEPDIQTNRPTTTSTFNRQYGPPTTQESIFEKIPSQGGPVSFLGIGTFSQFEHCLRECLERERRQTGMASQIIRQDIPSSFPVHDYGYDSIPIPPASYHHEFNPTTIHQFTDYPSRPTATFAIDDIRQINVALSRSGIPLFPYHRPYDDLYFSSIPSPNTIISDTYPYGRHTTGDVVSACRVVEEDPAILFNRNRSQAVQNVWNAIQNHQSFSHIDHLRSSVSPRGPYDI